MSLPLQGKVALVTGAGKNIGRTIALTLARDGAAIVVNGRSDRAAVDAVVGEIEAAGGRAMAAMGDVSDPTVPPRLAAEAAAKFGGVDILVSNAGLRRQTSFLDMSFEEWREIMSVALDGAFLLGKAIVPQMVARGGGAFVALSGISTHVGTPNRCHVSASKSGLEGLMRALAVELAPQAGVADEDVDAAERRGRLGRETRRHGGIGDIAHGGHRPAPGSLDLGHDGIDRRFVRPAIDHEGRAVAGQGQRNRPADILARARHQRDLALQG